MAQATARRYVIAVTALAGVLHVGSGAWAFFAPRSFYQTIATFPPYHVHFLHDIGAFLLGIGVALLLLVALGLRFPARNGPAGHGLAGHGQVEQPGWGTER